MHCPLLFICYGLGIAPFYLYATDNSCWVAHCKAVRRDIARDDRSGSDDAVISDVYTGQNRTRTPDPHIISDCDRLCPLYSFISGRGIKRMTSGIDAHIRSDKSIVTDNYFCLIKDDKIKVGKEVIAHFDIHSIIASERLIDRDIVAALA